MPLNPDAFCCCSVLLAVGLSPSTDAAVIVWGVQRHCASPLSLCACGDVWAPPSGGLLLGAALNARPHAFGAAVLRVAFLDLMGAMTDSDLPLTHHEYEEWGNPADPAQLARVSVP